MRFFLKFIAVVVVVVVAAAVLLLYVGVPSSFLVDQIRTRFAAETNYRLKIDGGAEIHLWPTLSIAVHDITLLNRDGEPPQNQVTVGTARADIELASLFSGKPKITEFTIVHPVVKMPLVRRSSERKAAPKTPSNAAKAPPQEIPVDRVTVQDATVLMVRTDGQIDSRIDHINLAATLSQPDHRLDAKISAKAGSQDLRIQIKSKAAIEKSEQGLPLELTVEAPGLLDDTLTSTVTVTSIGSLIKINDLEGTIGPHRFTGWASVDMTDKPRVKLDLDFKRLALAAAPESSAASEDARPSTFGQPWSDKEIDLDGLNYVDAQVAFSASELIVSTLRVAPVYIEGALVNGVANLGISNTGIYGGKADGVVGLNVSKGTQQQSMNMSLKGVRALPLLTALADFRELDGTMSGQIDVRASGSSERAIMGSLDGTLDISFKDGQIRNMNIAEMMRTLTKTTLNGWEKKRAEKTDLSELSVLFKINHGSAKTDNLKLYGPLIRVNGTGTADLAAQTLQFKLDSKLVNSLEGQGGAANPVGFGVPIMVEGKWDSPKIYPDMAGILDNPEAAYSKLNQLGAGLFGNGKSGTGGGDSMFKGLGNIFKGDNNKDDQAPAADDKKDPEQATPSPSSKPQNSQVKDGGPQDTQTKDSKPQDSQAKDSKAKDDQADDDDSKTRAKIKDLLNDLFGK
jgi:AsmA protein